MAETKTMLKKRKEKIMVKVLMMAMAAAGMVTFCGCASCEQESCAPAPKHDCGMKQAKGGHDCKMEGMKAKGGMGHDCKMHGQKPAPAPAPAPAPEAK